MFSESPWATRAAFTAAGPIAGLSWGALCVASWFHPESGTLSESAHFVGRLPSWLQSTVRWYASSFLSIFVLFCVIVWPMFSLSALWHLVK